MEVERGGLLGMRRRLVVVRVGSTSSLIRYVSHELAEDLMRLTLTKNICWAEWTGGCIKRSCSSIRTDSSIKLNGALLRSNSRGQSEERQDRLGKHCKERNMKVMNVC